MEIRPIDANALQELCNRGIQNMWNTGVAPVSWAAAYADFKNDIDSIPTLTPPNEWVSVEERLPENSAEVLMWREKWKIAEAGTYRNACFLVYDALGDSYKADDITYWMPLPAPPKKEHDHE